MARERMSRGDLLLVVAILSAAGAVIAAYLAYEWYQGFTSSVCTINLFFDCKVVGTSPYASFAGIPTATVGIAGFLIMLGLTVAAFRGVPRIGPWSVDRWILGFAALGAVLGLGLTMIEVFVIYAVCIFCAAGFALDLGILVLGWKLVRGGAGP